MLKKPNYKKLELQVYATFFEIYSGKVIAWSFSEKRVSQTFDKILSLSHKRIFPSLY